MGRPNPCAAARRDPAMDRRPPAALMEELVEEVLLRVPPDDPASLVRAALVCKPWCRLISGASFRRRFRELHRAAPMLGFHYEGDSGTEFVPASSSSFRPRHAVRRHWRVLDARHGRVLVLDVGPSYKPMETGLLVWDPVTDGQQRLPVPPFPPFAWSAAVLCATPGCGHLDCGRGGPFLVVAASSDVLGKRSTSAYVYSSEQGAWSQPITLEHQNDCIMRLRRAVVGNAVYFSYELNTRILEFDLGRQEPSIIDLPSEFHGWHIVLMEAEDGGLGFATVQDSRLCLWAREAGPDGYVGWAQRRVVELDTLLPVPNYKLPVPIHAFTMVCPPFVVAVAEGIDVIFLWTDGGLFTVRLKSSRVEKIGEFLSNFGVVPYVSFCTPASAALDMTSTGDEGPRVDASSASQT